MTIIKIIGRLTTSNFWEREAVYQDILIEINDAKVKLPK